MLQSRAHIIENVSPVCRITANARLPLASSASFDKNGAPAAHPSTSSPTAKGLSSQSTFARASAKGQEDEIGQQRKQDQPGIA